MRTKGWLLLLLFICTGCTEDRETQPSLEELGMVSLIAFDYIDETEMKITVAMPQPSEDAKEHTQSHTVEASLLKEGVVKLSTKSDRMVHLGQLRVALFSEEFAREGMMEKVVEYLYREPEARETVRIGIVKENAGEVITGTYPDRPNTSMYINNLLKPRLYTTFSPFTDLHRFTADIKNPLIDATVPYLEMKEGSPEITKVALFEEAKMIDTFNQHEGKIIQSIAGLQKIAPMDLELKKNPEEEVLIEFINTNVKLRGNNDHQSPKILIDVVMDGSVSAYRGPADLTKNKEVDRLEKDIEEKLKKDIKGITEKFKELKADPIGLFEPFRMSYRGEWTPQLSDELLEKVEFEVKVDVRIMNKGQLK